MIDYNEYGDKMNPSILLLHGAGALDTFAGQYCFSNKYHLIVPHLPGAGKAAAQPYNPEMVKRDLFELIDSFHKSKIGVIGHSLGAQLAIMLVCQRPNLFSFAVFLSAWVIPNPITVKLYCSLAAVSAKLLHIGWLVRLQGQYWNLTKSQAEYMAKYSKDITPQVYQSFFKNTLDLKSLPMYDAINVPMLAICGSGEVHYIKSSLMLLGGNIHCQTILFQKASHDFPMRKSKQLNIILNDFINTSEKQNTQYEPNSQTQSQ